MIQPALVTWDGPPRLEAVNVRVTLIEFVSWCWVLMFNVMDELGIHGVSVHGKAWDEPSPESWYLSVPLLSA